MVSTGLIHIFLMKTVLAAIMMQFACEKTDEQLFFTLFHDRNKYYEWDGTSYEQLGDIMPNFILIQQYDFQFGELISVKVVQEGATEVCDGILYRDIVVCPTFYWNRNHPDTIYSFYLVRYLYRNGNERFFKLVEHDHINKLDSQKVLQVRQSTECEN